MNSHLYGTSSPSALGGTEHRGQISEELIRQLPRQFLPGDVGRDVFLQIPHQAAAKSAREEGWNAWTRHSSLNFRALRVAALVDMICEIVRGATSAPSIDTTIISVGEQTGGEYRG